MKIKNIVNKHHKNKKMKIIRNRLKVIDINKINKMTYQKT